MLALLATAACLQARNAELAGNHDLAGRHWRRLTELTRREGAFDGEIVSLRALALERTGHAEQARHLRDALSVAGFARAGSERALTTTTRRD